MQTNYYFELKPKATPLSASQACSPPQRTEKWFSKSNSIKLSSETELYSSWPLKRSPRFGVMLRQIGTDLISCAWRSAKDSGLWKMLEQEYQQQPETTSEISYSDCDTTTSPNCLTTPFSVKDILNLNIPAEGNCGYQNAGYQNCSQYWENTCFSNYEYHNFGYYGCGEVKAEGFASNDGFNCNNIYVPPVQQPVCGISYGCAEDNKDSESPSKLL